MAGLPRLCTPAVRMFPALRCRWMTSYTPTTGTIGRSTNSVFHPLGDITSKFGDEAYWEREYSSGGMDQKSFEWFLPYEGGLRQHLLSFLSTISPGSSLVHLGCGTSDVGPKLAAEPGLNLQVTDIDSSPSAVRIMRRRHGQRSGYTCARADALNLPFPEASFDAAVDKGTIDALLCRSPEDAYNMAAEVHRVLRKGGIFLQVTAEDPDARLELLTMQKKGMGWSRSVFREIGEGEQFSYFLYALVK